MAPEQRHRQRDETSPGENTDPTARGAAVPVHAVDDLTDSPAAPNWCRPCEQPWVRSPLVRHCMVLEAHVAALEAQLERKDRQLEEIRDRYEEVLARREAGTESDSLAASWLPLD